MAFPISKTLESRCFRKKEENRHIKRYRVTRGEFQMRQKSSNRRGASGSGPSCHCCGCSAPSASPTRTMCIVRPYKGLAQPSFPHRAARCFLRTCRLIGRTPREECLTFSLRVLSNRLSPFVAVRHLHCSVADSTTHEAPKFPADGCWKSLQA